MKKLICTDMDNTLLKSDNTHVKAFNLAFKKNKLKKLSAKTLKKQLTGKRVEEIINSLYPNIPSELKNNLKRDHQYFVKTRTYKYAKAMMGVKRALKRLRKKYRIIIISNCSHREILQILKGAGISKSLFSRVIGEDEVKKQKPNPEAIFKARKLMHHKPDFMIGDSILDIKAAKKAKVRVMAVPSGHCTRQELLKQKPDYVVSRFSQMPGFLRKIDKP